MAAVAGGLGGVLISQQFLEKPETVYLHTKPNIVVQPASILESASCSEVARACYAQKRTGRVKKAGE